MLIGTASFCLVASLSLGEVLIAHGEALHAAWLLGNAALIGRSALPSLSDKLDTSMSTAMSLRALRESTLVQPAVTWLAIDAARHHDASRQEALLGVASRLGWRDEFTQRHLYNAAVRANRPDLALTYASALLRQNIATAQLSARLFTAMRFPGFSTALAHQLALGAPWADRWVASFGGALADQTLLELFNARMKARSTPDHNLTATLTSDLVARDRFAIANSVWRLATRQPNTFPQVMEWPSGAMPLPLSPFEWHLPQGYETEDDAPDALLAMPTASSHFAYRLLALPAGKYVLRVNLAPVSLSAWRWGFGCGKRARGGFDRLRSRNEVSVPQDCPIQWISLVASDAGTEIPRLPPFRIEKTI